MRSMPYLKIQTNVADMHKQPDLETNSQQLEAIYNKRMHRNNTVPLHFLAEQATLESQAVQLKSGGTIT